MRNLASFKTSLNFGPHAFENAAKYPNSETKMQCCDDRSMSSPSLVKLGPRTSEKALSVVPHRLRKRAIVDNSITQPPIIRFRSNFVEFERMTPEVL